MDAVLTKPGVFVYYDETGKPRRELRPPEEVFRPDALATLAHAPVTNRHHGLITSENFREWAVGHVAGEPRREGDTVVATLVIQDAETLADIRAGRREISCGTLWEIDPTPGVHPEWGPYDCIQRTARYNHVAIEPKARLGSDMRLRLDSAGHQNPTTPEDPPMKFVIRIDGKEYVITDEASALVAQAAFDASLSATRARLDAATAQTSALQARLDAAQSPQAIAAAVAARSALETVAKRFEIRCDGVLDSEVQRAVVAKAFPTLKLDGKDAVYISTLFDAAKDSVARNDAGATRAVEAPPVGGTAPATPGAVRLDGEEIDVEAARKAAHAKARARGNAPLKAV